MAFSSLRIQDASSTSDRMKRSNHPDNSAPTGPSPSLWPEPARPMPVPATARRVQFSARSQMAGAASTASDGASDKQQGSVQTGDAASSGPSSGHSTTSRMESSSTLPSSSSATTCPSPRPINVAVPNIFEPQYPRWYSYPPIHPTEFETRTPPAFIKDDLFDPTDVFLQRSNAFQNWVNKKNAERIQLRHNPAYEKLVEELHEYQRIGDQGRTPAIRANAKYDVGRIEAALVEERKKFSAAELKHIRDIEKAWVSFVSIDNHEQAIAKQRHTSTTPQVNPERSLSKVERLLGSDGSSLGTPSQNLPYRGVGAGSTVLGGGDTKTAASNLSEKLPAPAGVTTWPDKPYEILIPDWFPVAEAQGIIHMDGAAIEDRFKSLLSYIYQLELEKSQLSYQANHPKEEGIVRDYTWDKHWHPPNPGWRHEHQKKRGGLWKCRKGPAGTAAENTCKLCPDIEISKPPPPAQLLDHLMKDIGEAMAIVARNDKDKVFERRSGSNDKPASAEMFRQLDEDVKMWALRDSNTVTITQPEMISLGAREPWINYNPLRGLGDMPETTTMAQTYAQQAGKNEEQRMPCNEDIGKGKKAS
ncbi:hypothetical protein F4859DRAFT_461996 [Xylaria cf. heliscus]|nr:hypothetical protein F4859DRAFT_461996 [Xylaria cf. heliscus]